MSDPPAENIPVEAEQSPATNSEQLGGDAGPGAPIDSSSASEPVNADAEGSRDAEAQSGPERQADEVLDPSTSLLRRNSAYDDQARRERTGKKLVFTDQVSETFNIFMLAVPEICYNPVS